MALTVVNDINIHKITVAQSCVAKQAAKCKISKTQMKLVRLCQHKMKS